MANFNIQNTNSPAINYSLGLLPQRNQPHLWYQDTSCRSNLTDFSISSENRRIINKTTDFSHHSTSLAKFNFSPSIQKQLSHWIKTLEWDFPISSVKNIFKNHIFNTLYVWKNPQEEVVAYGVCLFTTNFSHIAYVFYNPAYNHSNLPIRMVLQVIIDSQHQGLKYCYLGRNHSSKNGYYKRNMPGYEYYKDKKWVKYK